MYYIYALCKPDGTPFYIGRSTNPQRRLQSHLCDRKCEAKWQIIQSLRDEGLKPTLQILFETEDEYTARVEEMKQINLHWKSITNRIEGDGVLAKEKIGLGLLEEYVPAPDSEWLPPDFYCRSCSYQWLSRVEKPTYCPRCKRKAAEPNQKTLF